MTLILERCPKRGRGGGDRLEGPPSHLTNVRGGGWDRPRKRAVTQSGLSTLGTHASHPAESVAATQPHRTRGAVPDTVGNPRALFLEKEK